jgi:hypothetical protein
METGRSSHCDFRGHIYCYVKPIMPRHSDTVLKLVIGLASRIVRRSSDMTCDSDSDCEWCQTISLGVMVSAATSHELLDPTRNASFRPREDWQRFCILIRDTTPEASFKKLEEFGVLALHQSHSPHFFLRRPRAIATEPHVAVTRHKSRKASRHDVGSLQQEQHHAKGKLSLRPGPVH